MATPAQIAARERFAEMARSGELAKMRKKATRKSNPASKQLKMKIRGSETPDNPEGIVVTEAGALKFAKQNMPNDLKRAGFVPSIVAGARGWSINYGMKVKNNPAKTVSQEISQQMRKGKGQKQAVAIALEMERAGKLRKNPINSYEIRHRTGIKSGNVVEKFNDIGLAKDYLDEIDKPIGSYYGYDVKNKRVFFSFAYETKFPHAEIAAIAETKRLRKNNPTATRAPARPRTKLISNGREKNPMAPAVQVSSDSMFKYAVEARRSLGSAGSVFETVAAFHTKAQAQDYAKAILASNPNVTLRVKTYGGRAK